MKTARIELRVYHHEKQELNKLASGDGKSLTSYILSKLGLESTEIEDHTLQVIKTSRDIPHKTIHGLFYYSAGKVYIFRNYKAINLQSKIATMLKIKPSDSLFIYFDNNKNNLVFSTDNSISYEFECPVFQGPHSLVVILPKELIQELDYLPGTPILLYYFSVNDFFCCKKISDFF